MKLNGLGQPNEKTRVRGLWKRRSSRISSRTHSHCRSVPIRLGIPGTGPLVSLLLRMGIRSLRTGLLLMHPLHGGLGMNPRPTVRLQSRHMGLLTARDEGREKRTRRIPVQTNCRNSDLNIIILLKTLVYKNYHDVQKIVMVRKRLLHVTTLRYWTHCCPLSTVEVR